MFCFIKFIYIFLILVNFTKYIKNEVINILMQKPDMDWLQFTNEDFSLINNYFKTLSANDKELQNIEIKFTYFNFAPNEKLRYRQQSLLYLITINEMLKTSNSTYDMMIMDDRLLFSDTSFTESYVLEKDWNLRKVHHNYLKISDYINLNDTSLAHHNPNILNEGILRNDLYGLPYELDFDVLYYFNSTINLNSIPNLNELSWDELMVFKNSIGSSNFPINAGLYDDDELINLFIEYVSEKYNLTEEKKKKSETDFYEIFYNKNSKELYESFRNFIHDFTGFDSFNTKISSAFDKFCNEKNSFFKGKASYYTKIALKNKDISTFLLPKLFTVINEKYLVINKYSKVKKEILVKIALQLTSKKMQLFKYDKFYTIPTFDMKKISLDKDILSFCEKDKWLCSSLGKINAIHIKQFFGGKFSAPFLLVRINIPVYIENYVRTNNITDTALIFKNIKELYMTTPNGIDKNSIILLIFMGIFTLLSLYIMLLVYEYRKNPYLKVISPRFSNLIILGFIMCINSLLFNVQIHSVTKCKVQLIYEVIYNDFIILPMLVITFRIFFIYRNKSRISFGKKLNNNRLSIFIAVVVLITIIFCLITINKTEFRIITLGDLRYVRFPICYYKNETFNLVIASYYLIIVACIIILVCYSGKAAKLFRLNKFIVIFGVIVIIDLVMSKLLFRLTKILFSLSSSSALPSSLPSSPSSSYNSQ
ncbi:hypothetical protein H8356DRAFT_1291140 [Neocallimastix lanati (nom. inval.)]|uniref:G-protein coupled receptors family 3 profile domain-containing protein n=1 Tax=Neocallimastix californiae TaxID=1754190 RepID=A0A1Y2B7J3_9FUNG|nr:hypothetical protein H8356DRAFT_1291140 [Neocallimastix sp. JGI-2020a]ORY30656.1 hypothetical protein LY90DRAFT_673807 [Neocallimastix californiae]|eukprot:ORY30656.1 hypothetical protein LY90DRAFT_673807 [Neocallimastix californiae]